MSSPGGKVQREPTAKWKGLGQQERTEPKKAVLETCWVTGLDPPDTAIQEAPSCHYLSTLRCQVYFWSGVPPQGTTSANPPDLASSLTLLSSLTTPPTSLSLGNKYHPHPTLPCSVFCSHLHAVQAHPATHLSPPGGHQGPVLTQSSLCPWPNELCLSKDSPQLTLVFSHLYLISPHQLYCL